MAPKYFLLIVVLLAGSVATASSTEDKESLAKASATPCAMDMAPCLKWIVGGLEVNPDAAPVVRGLTPKQQCCSMMTKLSDKCQCDVFAKMVKKECPPTEEGFCREFMLDRMMQVPQTCKFKTVKLRCKWGAM